MSPREILHSWKEISRYLGRDVRTCRRWEEQLGLPVRRLDRSPKARVLAYKDEVDRWLDMKLHEHDVEKPRSRPGRIIGLRFPTSLSVSRRWPFYAVFSGILVFGVLGWRAINDRGPGPVRGGGRPQLAVLPFVNGTGDDGLSYLRESVADHLIRDLQRNAEDVTVFSFDAVAKIVRDLGLEPGEPLTPGEIAAVAARTGAGWLLLGYISRAGSRLCLDYELCEAGAAEAFKTGHVPGAEAEVATMENRVADGVRRAFGVPTATSPGALETCSVQATRVYEMARAIERRYVLSLSSAELDKIIGLFNQVRAADPGCALAYLGLGDAYQHRFAYEGHSRVSLRLMEENYRRAYDMAPGRAETQVGLAWVHFFSREYDQAYACLKRALTLDPASLHVLTDIGAFLRSIGLLERGAGYFTRVIRAGGTTTDIFLLRAWTYEQMGLYESALADFDRIIELEPSDFRTRCHRARVLILMGRYDAAAAELAVAETLEPGADYTGLVRALAAAAKGERKAALAAIEPARAAGRPGRYTYYLSRVYAALGLTDEAVKVIELAIDKGFEDVYDELYVFPFLNNTRDHFYDGLRGEPRFAEILRREERKYADKLEKYGGL